MFNVVGHIDLGIVKIPETTGRGLISKIGGQSLSLFDYYHDDRKSRYENVLRKNKFGF